MDGRTYMNKLHKSLLQMVKGLFSNKVPYVGIDTSHIDSHIGCAFEISMYETWSGFKSGHHPGQIVTNKMQSGKVAVFKCYRSNLHQGADHTGQYAYHMKFMYYQEDIQAAPLDDLVKHGLPTDKAYSVKEGLVYARRLLMARGKFEEVEGQPVAVEEATILKNIQHGFIVGRRMKADYEVMTGKQYPISPKHMDEGTTNEQASKEKEEQAGLCSQANRALEY
jgi:hypothetical protein